MKPITTFVMGDLHFGHKRIPEFRTQYESMEEHEAHIMTLWQDTVGLNDRVWLLGDVAFTPEGLHKIGRLNGTKFMVRGNHDTMSLAEYQFIFQDVLGLVKYKRKHREPVWLSHAPIHPDELRGCINIHGHVHTATVCIPGTFQPDPNYINVCPEAVGYAPIPLHDLIPRKAG